MILIKIQFFFSLNQVLFLFLGLKKKQNQTSYFS